MGTGLQSLSQVTGQDMAKVLCILAMASTLSAAPRSPPDPYYGSRPRINSAVDADSVVESVMRTLGPEMDAAIEAAMRGLSSPVTGFSSGLRGLSNSAPVTNFRGTVSSSPAVTVHLSGSSRGENSQSQWSSQSSSSSKHSNFESHSTSGIGSNFGSSSFGATGFGATGSGSSSGIGSTSQSNQEAVVDSVISQLGPSITAAVEAALASSQSSSSQQSFQAQQSLQAQKAQQAQSFQQSQFSSSESELVSQIIAALTPSITQSVSAALAGQTSTSVTTITQQQQAQAAAAAAQAQAEAQRQAAAAAQAAAAQQMKQQELVQQVLAALSGQIESTVASMLS